MDQEKSNAQFRGVISHIKKSFLAKKTDYGDSWKINRFISNLDQILIKLWRIRTIQESGKQKVEDPLRGEFVGALNYAVFALQKLESVKPDYQEKDSEVFFDIWTDEAFLLFQKKNHDYGEMWRKIQISSMVDFSITKLVRIMNMGNPKGSEVSEDYEAGLLDIINYMAFCLILIEEGVDPMK